MTRINRYVIENFVKISATQNVEGEPVGALNRFYGKVVHPDRQPDQRFLPDAEAAQQAAFDRLQVHARARARLLDLFLGRCARTRTSRRPRSDSSSGRSCASPILDATVKHAGGPLPDPAARLGALHGPVAGDLRVAAAADGRRPVPHADARRCSSSAARSCRCRRCASSARSSTCRSPRRRRSTTARRCWSSSWRWSFSASG